jgi:hypothetical protein
MQYKVVKLDNRYAWSKNFRWCLEFTRSEWTGTGVLDFDRARRWMNQTWGWSQDVETMNDMARILNRRFEPWDDQINPHWAYAVQYKNYRIYLKGDQELSWFQMVHPCAE